MLQYFLFCSLHLRFCNDMCLAIFLRLRILHIPYEWHISFPFVTLELLFLLMLWRAKFLVSVHFSIYNSFFRLIWLLNTLLLQSIYFFPFLLEKVFNISVVTIFDKRCIVFFFILTLQERKILPISLVTDCL